MNTIKKIVSVILSLAIVGAFAGCKASGTKEKGKEHINSTSNIEISYWNSGLSTEWLDAVIAGFEKAHPEYTVTYSASSSTAAVVANFGNEEDTVDLYMSIKDFDTTKLEPLDDVLSATAK